MTRKTEGKLIKGGLLTGIVGLPLIFIGGPLGIMSLLLIGLVLCVVGLLTSLATIVVTM